MMLMFNSTISAIFAKGTTPVRLAFHPFAFLFRRDKVSKLAKQYDEVPEADEEIAAIVDSGDEGPSDDTFEAYALKIRAKLA